MCYGLIDNTFLAENNLVPQSDTPNREFNLFSTTNYILSLDVIGWEYKLFSTDGLLFFN
jgi:hypothetical protein